MPTPEISYRAPSDGLHPTMLVDAEIRLSDVEVMGYVLATFEAIDGLSDRPDPRGVTFRDHQPRIIDMHGMDAAQMTRAEWTAFAIHQASRIVTPSYVAGLLKCDNLEALADLDLQAMSQTDRRKLGLLWWTAKQIERSYDEVTAQAWLIGARAGERSPIRVIRDAETADQAAVSVVSRITDFIF